MDLGGSKSAFRKAAQRPKHHNGSPSTSQQKLLSLNRRSRLDRCGRQGRIVQESSSQSLQELLLSFITVYSPASCFLLVPNLVTMKYLAAYLLLTIGGNTAPTAADVSALLATVGVETESERVKALIAQLAGKDINEVLEEN